ncbi:MAG: adenosine kinase [Bacteroidales bacterium]|nr:adenosine kinase [Bacteroidales bacterium]
MQKKVLGVGNALVDILVNIDDNFLEKNHLAKGSMQLVDKERIEELLTKLDKTNLQQASGGSAANTIFGLNGLGTETGYIGKIGHDPLGNYFIQELSKQNILSKVLYSEKTDTGTALTLITPDSERTFATYLGAAVELGADDLRPSFFKDFSLLHLEGYLVYNHQLIEHSIHLAKNEGMEISLDLASYNVVEANKDFLYRIIEEAVDIVFANELEAKALTGKEPEDAVEKIAQICKVAVVKVGAKGSWVMVGKDKYFIEAFKVKSIDTTGAGDLYAAGFLHGYLNNWPWISCGKLGSLVASEVIQVIGAKVPTEKWEDINRLKTTMV